MSLAKQDRPYSYSDYLSWDEGERWELIDGFPYAMSPAPSRKHQQIAGALYYNVKSFLSGKRCQAYFAPFDVRLATPGTADKDILTVVQPDLVVVCDHSKLDERGCLGAPDLVIEILSPSSAKMDMVTKLQLYEKYAVREYWLVHPTDETIMVYRLNEDGRYGRYDLLAREDILTSDILPDFEMALATLFDEVREA